MDAHAKAYVEQVRNRGLFVVCCESVDWLFVCVRACVRACVVEIGGVFAFAVSAWHGVVERRARAVQTHGRPRYRNRRRSSISAILQTVRDCVM